MNFACGAMGLLRQLIALHALLLHTSDAVALRTRRAVAGIATASFCLPTACRALGVTQGLLDPCPETASCVSSQDDAARGGRAFAEPCDRYVRCVARSGGAVDDLEFYFTENDATVQFRAARRGGAQDLGANAQRLERLRRRCGFDKIVVLRNRRRKLGFIESPLDSFGPSFFDQGDAALLDPDALRTRDVDPLAPPSFPAPSRETRAWLREKRAEATRSRYVVACDVPFLGATLGIAFHDDGSVKGVAPGGEAEAKGVKPGDRVEAVAGEPCGSPRAVADAVKAHAERPIVLSLSRTVRDTDWVHVFVEFEGPRLGLAFSRDGAVASVMPGGEAEAKGVARGDRVTCVADEPCGGSDARIIAAASSRAERPLVGAVLGLAFGPDGAVRGVMPGGEAERKGIRVGDVVTSASPSSPTGPSRPSAGGEARGGVAAGDRIVGVGDVLVRGLPLDAIRAHAARPITLAIAKASGDPPTPVGAAASGLRPAPAAPAPAPEEEAAAEPAPAPEAPPPPPAAAEEPRSPMDKMAADRDASFEDAEPGTYNIEVIFLDDEDDVKREALAAEARRRPARRQRRRRFEDAPRRSWGAQTAGGSSPRDVGARPPPDPRTVYGVVIGEAGPMGMALIMRTISGHNVVVVRSVAPGGRADRAGVLVNSRLYSVNDVRISSDAGDDPYAVLGIHKQASSVEVRKSYKRESLQKHPDRPGGAVDDFIQLHSAYDILMDDRARRDYDNNAANDDFDKATALIKASGRPLRMTFFKPTGELGREAD
ncbi:hypothetical protein JL720_8944 [Aureococcus anophagefferens]|nr:hypothetical protein JL720_8944 [Aureococcus anophagefferens]